MLVTLIAPAPQTTDHALATAALGAAVPVHGSVHRSLRGSAWPWCQIGFAALLVACAAQAAAQAAPASAPSAQPRAVAPRGALSAEEQRVVSLFEQAAPSVAYITTQVVQTNVWLEQRLSEGAGSGFVWDNQGHVVSNNHVIEGAQRVFVKLDAGEAIEAVVVGRAPEYDLAVLRLSRFPADLRPIPIGASKDLKIGQTVFAIGNPFGLQRTLTRGLVSALDRELPTTSYREVAGVIQTDAAINPGNSGGPLLDSAGRLIGVNTAIRSASGSSAGVSFSIPVDLVNRVVPALISRGRAPLPGIGFTAVRPDIVARSGIRGVVMQRLDPNGPAAKAGLLPYNPATNEVGDVIVAINGKIVESITQLVSEFDRLGVDVGVELTVKRHNRDERKVRLRVIDLRA